VAAAVLDGIAGVYGEFRAGGFGSLRAEYESRHVLAGREILVHDGTDRVIAAGAVAGVDDGGRLLVRDDSGITAVAAGEVTLRAPEGSAS